MRIYIYIYCISNGFLGWSNAFPLKITLNPNKSQQMQAGRPIEKVRKLRSNQLDLKSLPPKKNPPCPPLHPFLKYSPQLAHITSPQRPQMFAFAPGHRKRVFNVYIRPKFPAKIPGREALEGTRQRIEQHVGARRGRIWASINVAAVVPFPQLPSMSFVSPNGSSCHRSLIQQGSMGEKFVIRPGNMRKTAN